jgi:hypothetical protein
MRFMQPSELLIKMAFQTWEIQVSRTNKLLASLSDDQLQHEIAPGRNSGLYVVGHLAAVHDAMIPLLGLGQRLHPEWDAIFISSPDKADIKKPDANTVRQVWAEVNDHLGKLFKQMPAEEWFQKHNAVSEEDFANEPHRNKLSVLLNRSSHIAYHLGQLVLLK